MPYRAEITVRQRIAGSAAEGTENALVALDPPLGGSPFTPNAGGPIRTLSVSLLAVAAIAASLLIVRREQRPQHGLVPAGEVLPAEQSLDAIREAGL